MWELIQNQFNTNDFFKGGFILSIFAGVGIYLKSFIPIIRNFILRQISYSTTIESKTELYDIFNVWLYENYNYKYKKVISSSTWDATNIGERLNASADESSLYYKENNFNSNFNIFYKGCLIRVEATREKFEAANSTWNMHVDSYTLTSYFSKKGVRDLLNQLILEFNKNKSVKKETLLFDFRNHNDWCKQGIVKSKPYDKIFNSEKIELLEDIKNFLDNRQYYEDRGIPYRRGYLLEGKPGNGKTSTILAIANKLKRDVYNLNLSSVSDDTYLKYAFSNLTEGCFLLIEDIDASLRGREKIDKVNFNTLLNVLDGSLAKENICVFFTTNHVEQLDPALIRTGRIDKKIEFKNPTKKDIIEMLSLFYPTCEKLEFNYVEDKHASEIQELLIQSLNYKEAINKLCNTRTQ